MDINLFNQIIGNNSHYYFYLCFIKNMDFLNDLFNSIDKTIFNYNNCKDYYYTLKIPFTNYQKTYSKFDIIELFHLIPNYNYTKNIDYDLIDNFYLYYIYYKSYFIKLFEAHQKALNHYYNVKEFNYIFIVPDLLQKKYNIQKINFDSSTMIKLYQISNQCIYPLPIPNDFI